MMKPTGLLAATGVLLILGGTIWYFQKHPKAPDTPATPPVQKLLSAPVDQITGIRLAKTGADPIVLKNLAGKWVIAEPKQLPADQEAAQSLAINLAPLSADRLLEDKPASLDAFGLTTPTEEIDVTLKNGSVEKLLFGADTPSGGDTYAKLDGKPAVYTVFTSTKNNVDKGLTDLRDKRLLPYTQEKLTSIVVTSKGPAFTIAKDAQGDWQIVKPSPMRADANQVEQLLTKLKDAKMDTAATDQKEIDKQFAAGAVIGTVTVTDNTGPFALTVRKGKDNAYYAKSSALDGTYKLTGDLADGLKDRDIDSFRNKKLFDFGFTDPSKVEIDGAAYQKSGEKWTGPKGQMDASSIQAVVDKLRDLSASKFADKMAGTPAQTISVTSGDKNKLEKIALNKAGEDYDVQRDGDPAVYVLSAASYGDLQKAIAAIKPYQAPAANKK
jgi:hypothetical protein